MNDTELPTPAPPEVPNAPAPFPVIGIGGSAGALGPIADILGKLGAENVAVVVVTHLDPTHVSSLPGILARSTPMPVVSVTDGMPLEPRNVYVLPPNAQITVAGGRLHLFPRSDENQHTPIDKFLRSLADDRGPASVAVIVSGTGSDGSRGLRFIKEAGGITIAQDGSAVHDGMPTSAIATGSVDLVLPPEAIGEELRRIARSNHAQATGQTPADSEPDIARVLTAVHRATGIDFTNYKPTTLHRRISRRALLRRTENLAEYAALVEGDKAEAVALSEEVLIHVTSFFRDPDAFTALQTVVFPHLVEGRRSDSPIRIWVPGCATGEEAYSIAIALTEFIETSRSPDTAFKVFGTDVSTAAIERARAAVYPESITRDISPGRLRRFFVKTDGSYQILKEIRDRCVFAAQDVKRDPPFAKIDLISCRNLMIYLSPPLQQRILPLFHYALSDPGFLLLGSSESPGTFAGFTAIDAKNKIYGRAPLKRSAPLDFGEPRGWEPLVHPTASPTAEKRPKLEDIRRDADRAVVKAVAPVGLLVSDDLTVLDFRGETGPFVQPAPGAASLDLLRLAHEDLRIPLGRAVALARQTRATERGRAAWGTGESRQTCEIEVIPFVSGPSQANFFSVLFRTPAPDAPAVVGAPAAPVEPPAPSVEADLRRELTSTREYLQSVVERLESGNEDLRAANEEVVAANEELQSTNEELQTTSEELQATNEELRSVNEEMLDRNVVSTRLSEDLTNVLNSVSIPIVLVGRDGRIRRFTPAATKILSVIAGDIGRPITDIQPKFEAGLLNSMMDDVLGRLAPVERVVRGEDGRWYQLGVRPYVTLDNRIDGTVITALDVDLIKNSELLLTEARDYAETIVETMHEQLIVLDPELRVRSANRSFYQAFGAAPRETEGRLLFDLGRGEWDTSELRDRLAALKDGVPFDGLLLDREFGKIGRRILVLSGRRVSRGPWLLLSIEDTTERARAAEALKESEARLRLVLASAGTAILMTDDAGKVVFSNAAAQTLFGYSESELSGMLGELLIPERFRAAQRADRPAFLAAANLPVPAPSQELIALHRDGREIPVVVSFSRVVQEHGPCIVSFITDNTERNETARKLQEYQTKLQRAAFEAAVVEQQERRRIAVDLHDHLAQKLAVAQMRLTAAREATTGAPRAAIDQAFDLVSESINDTRSLTFDLCPPILYDLGLYQALGWLAEDMEKRFGLRVEIDATKGDVKLDDVTAAIVYRAVRELLLNVLKHADTPSARIALRGANGAVTVEVEDKGVGFDMGATNPQAPGFGLFSVREQVDRLGGAVKVESSLNRGTRVTLEVPLVGSPPESKSKGDGA